MGLLSRLKMVIIILKIELYGMNWIPYSTANQILFLPGIISTDRPKAAPLLQFGFVCASVVSYVVFVFITKTRLYSFDPLKPHFYIIKLGLLGYILFFLFLLKNIDCWYSLEPPQRGGSNE